MGTILNGKYLSMPEQVQKNKNDIQVITEYLENIYKCSTALEESSTSINIEYTNIEDKRDFLFAFLLDNKGLLFKIIDIVGDIVYLEFYSKLPSVDFNYLGEWVAGNNEYHPNDVVLYNGSLYICENTILDSSVAPPQDTTNWSLFLGFGEDIGLFINDLYNNRNDIGYISKLKPIKIWENPTPSTPFEGGSSVDFTEAIEEDDLIRIDVRRNTSQYAGNLSFFVTSAVLSGSIPLSFNMYDANQITYLSRLVTFYSRSRLYIDSNYSNGVLNNYLNIPVAIYRYKGMGGE